MDRIEIKELSNVLKICGEYLKTIADEFAEIGDREISREYVGEVTLLEKLSRETEDMLYENGADVKFAVETLRDIKFADGIDIITKCLEIHKEYTITENKKLLRIMSGE